MKHPWIRLAFLIAQLGQVFAQDQDNLGLKDGYITLASGNVEAQIVKDSQTLASLTPTSESSFDFLAFDYLPQRAYNGAHHIGDITLRYNTGGHTNWTSADSASNRAPVTALSNSSQAIAASDLTKTLPSGIPFKITREWLKIDQDIGLRFNITNKVNGSVELGSLGLPIYINNIFVNRSAEDVQNKCSLADPYIGLDAGYVRVTPISGTGSALVISPLGSSPFEAWRFLSEPQGNVGYQIQTFEGSYEWQIHTKAWAENEWNASTPWNAPTSKTLAAGETYSVGLRLSISPSIPAIEDTVVSTKTPLALGVPGYIIPADATASLYLNYSSLVKSIDTEGAFTVANSSGSSLQLTPSTSKWGRSRVTITYADGKRQAVHYYVTKAATQTIAELGNFLTTTQYYNDTSDPFGRAPSVISYDREANAMVLQDPRVWIAGLSDEAGAGSYLAASMKQSAQPVAREVAALDTFIHKTLWHTIQAPPAYGVRASTFFYQPNATTWQYDPSIDWTTWASWDKDRAYSTWRAYNYIHVTAAYWSMYRVARYYPQAKTESPWSWYLNQAFETIQTCLGNTTACDYATDGLMGETVLGELLADLERENFTSNYNTLKATLKSRASYWNTEAVPYGSEQAWDSTGQEGIYYWSDYFGYNATAVKTINTILGYMPTVAHWGWNGNARRYWDFLYGGKIERYERQIHHYGSGLNALPLLSYFEKNPDDFYALRVGFGGTSGPLSNIDQEGFASAAFHSYPDTLKWDPYSGDYGPNFLGLVLGHAAYVVDHPQFGYVAFGGNINVGGDTITVQPRDAVRKKAFIAEMGLKIELAAGLIQEFSFQKASKEVTLKIGKAATSNALVANQTVVWLSEPASGSSTFKVANMAMLRGGWSVPLGADATTIKISQ